MTDFSNVELASFDVWMTLIKSNPHHKAAQAELIASEWGIPSDGFLEVMKDEDRLADHESDTSGVQLGPVERLERIATRVGAVVSSKSLVQLAEQAQELAGEYLPHLLEEDLLASLDTIRSKGIKTAIISNTGFINGAQMRKNLTAVGIFPRMDHALFSNEVGVAKPNVKIFELLATYLGVKKDRIMHIGDNQKADVAGATQAGFRAVHLARQSNAALHVPTIAEFAQRLNSGEPQE